MQPNTMNVAVTRPDEAALITGAESALSIAQSIEIDSPEMYRLAGDELASIKGKAKQLDEQRKSITKPLDDAKKAVMDLFRRPLEVLTSAEGILKRSMLAYDQEQRRKQEEEQRKARIAAEAERQRQQAEADKKAEEARQAAEAGDVKKAAELQQQAEETAAVAEMITAPVIQLEKPKASGVAVRKTYKARVTDLKALLQGVIDGVVPDAVIEINESVLNSQARSLKESMKYPGVEVYTEEGISARSA
jgi:hypothetical protein